MRVWVVDRDGSLAGFSVSIADGDVAFYEVLTIAKSGAGRWVYTAYPSNQPAASFAARRVDDNAVQFLNASHDYPQVIEYSREDNSLTAVVSYIGGADAQTFAKTACAGAESTDTDTDTDADTATDTDTDTDTDEQ